MNTSSSINWILSLSRTRFLLPVQQANINFETDFCRLKIQLIKLDFSNLSFQRLSTDHIDKVSDSYRVDGHVVLKIPDDKYFL